MIFEKLALKDFEKIKPLLNGFKESVHEELLTECQFTELKNAIENKKIMFFIALVNDETVAMCSITTAFSTFKCKNMGIFDDFYINPFYRGKGVAANLVNFVFDEMKKMNIKSLWVGCTDTDVGMYKHLGFSVALGNLLAWSNI